MEVVEDLMELLVLSLGFVVGNCVTSRSLAAGVSFTLTSHIANHTQVPQKFNSCRHSKSFCAQAQQYAKNTIARCTAYIFTRRRYKYAKV
jgi:hypothetical protein